MAVSKTQESFRPPSKYRKKSSGFISTYFSYIKPLYPSRIPIICVSGSALYNVFCHAAHCCVQSLAVTTTGQKKLLVSYLPPLSKVRVLDTFFSLPYFAGLGNSGMNFVRGLGRKKNSSTISFQHKKIL